MLVVQNGLHGGQVNCRWRMASTNHLAESIFASQMRASFCWLLVWHPLAYVSIISLYIGLIAARVHCVDSIASAIRCLRRTTESREPPEWPCREDSAPELPGLGFSCVISARASFKASSSMSSFFWMRSKCFLENDSK